MRTAIATVTDYLGSSDEGGGGAGENGLMIGDWMVKITDANYTVIDKVEIKRNKYTLCAIHSQYQCRSVLTDCFDLSKF